MSKKNSTKGPRATLIPDAELFLQLCERETLREAWSKVWRNAGAAGGDGVSVYDFAARAEMLLGVLSHELKEGRYQPGLLRQVDIPKRSGEKRRLNIPCVRDRIVQTAVTNLLVPYMEEEFEETSFGYRPGRSIYQAVARIQSLQRSGLTHVVDADIDDYFDCIPHDALLSRLTESMEHGPLSELIALWLSQAAPQGRGVAQGSPLSPLLANLYLDRLDEAFDKKGARIVRFADDFVVLARSPKGADAAMDDIAHLLASHGLKLNREKTRVTDFNQGFKFLGHLFIRSMALKTAPEEADLFDAVKLMAQLAREDAAEQEQKETQAEVQKRQEDGGLVAGFRNLYIMQSGRRLSIRNEAFAVEELQHRENSMHGTEAEWREILAVPHQQIDRIDIGPEAEATQTALDHALATGTVVCFVDGHGATKGTLAPTLAPRARRHAAQAATTLDETKRLALARIFVEGRLRNQRGLLRKLGRERDTMPATAIKAIASLTSLIGRGDTSRIRHAKSVEMAMGYEGTGTAAYWKAVSALAHRDFKFSKREREQPNPANIALNFLAWLLHRDISMAVLATGLHPGFGALHSLDDNRDACVYDLMEEFRGHFVEGLFVYVTNRRILRADMFSHQSGHWRMKNVGSQALIRAYETRAQATITWPPKTKRASFRRLMIKQAHALARHHEKGETYRPFEIDY